MTGESMVDHVVVTGGASGIGDAVVGRLLDRGIDVTVFDLRPSVRLGVPTRIVDLRDESAVEAAMTETWAYAPVGGLVACHGIRGAYVPALEMDLDQLRLMFDVHVVGALAASRALVRRLGAAPGSIVLVSSTTAYRGWANQTDYGPAKAAERQLMENLAVEWAPRGVRVNAVAPGHTLTPLVQEMVEHGYDLAPVVQRIPRGRLADPAEIAAAIVWMLCDATHVIGQCLPVDGGWTVVGR
ncbi:SDR family NAD(P)-dependent oxidoreductase [Microbacterium sp. zg.Y909]|uniref:SDR family NAD(P)-dependent oxidoreductase n=1 Tax=Microbacterium sp. zg.Y909 TaxID=2969413 RepID=UPI00214C28B5|nr:SDR family oxidoreductase [Microbacterium sp. zg.Y909]MCR2824192.1 SDR family oxidoreductase [Microbacterium sp. zg.Y909]